MVIFVLPFNHSGRASMPYQYELEVVLSLKRAHMRYHSFVTVCTLLFPVLDVKAVPVWMVVTYHYGTRHLMEPLWITQIGTSTLYLREFQSGVMGLKYDSMAIRFVNMVVHPSIEARSYSVVP